MLASETVWKSNTTLALAAADSGKYRKTRSGASFNGFLGKRRRLPEADSSPSPTRNRLKWGPTPGNDWVISQSCYSLRHVLMLCARLHEGGGPGTMGLRHGIHNVTARGMTNPSINNQESIRRMWGNTKASENKCIEHIEGGHLVCLRLMSKLHATQPKVDIV